MGLLRIQQELAAILLEPDTRRSFAEGPRASLRSRGVAGRDLDLLGSLDADDLVYFAERRTIDRLHALRADAPRATAALPKAVGRHGALSVYVRTHPYSLEDPVAETARFARWCQRAAKEGLVPAVAADLAAVDAAVLRLLRMEARSARASARPRRAPGVRILRLGHAVGPALRSGDAAQARPGPAVLALRRTPDEVRWRALSAIEAALLATADGRRARAAWLKAAASAAGVGVATTHKAASGLARDGFLVPEPWPSPSPKAQGAGPAQGRRHG